MLRTMLGREIRYFVSKFDYRLSKRQANRMVVSL